VTATVARYAVASPADYAECHRVMFGASQNYAFASRLLPGGIIEDVEALYALMRVGDDRVDVAPHGGGHQDFESALAAIDDWEECYRRAFATGASDHPVMRAYLNTAFRHGIPADVMSPYFRSMREDITVTRFPTYAALLHYMEGSALPVGRAMIYMVGVRPPHTVADALPHADSLSLAMQLSNFWRDVGQDSRIGRIYIPLDDMTLFGVTEDDIAAGRVSPQFIDLMEFEMGRAEQYYRDARVAVPWLRHGRWAVMAGLEIYRAIHTSIRRNGYDVFTKRATTTKLEKAGLALRAEWLTLTTR
jgi:15-cis-phytoene synthase